MYTAVVALFLPGVVLILGAGFIFGFWRGLLAVWAGGAVGQALAFLLARYLFRGWVENTLRHKWAKWAIIDKAIEQDGWKLVLILRFSPIIPYNLVGSGGGEGGGLAWALCRGADGPRVCALRTRCARWPTRRRGCRFLRSDIPGPVIQQNIGSQLLLLMNICAACPRKLHWQLCGSCTKRILWLPSGYSRALRHMRLASHRVHCHASPAVEHCDGHHQHPVLAIYYRVGRGHCL